MPRRSRRPAPGGPFAAYATRSPVAAYRHFLALCWTLATAELEEPGDVDADTVRQRIERGLRALEPHLEVVRAQLPECPIHEVLELRALALAFVFVSARVGREAGGEAPTTSREGAAADVRRRLWTLIRRRHDHLREAGVVALGLPQLDEHVPPLCSRLFASKA